ncbi:G2 M phase-specific E3 ubiquitin- ligase-like protein [Labeo rohita]|uniref:G2 M phase-specific E3 ubiquitin-ligase-like protein n=1 Tax=Labeo rohita TaxID=84645 RepID=A0A498NST6_LABRO|nr:G2 M phase-specific E3 ubiquitin- ligase-like protein [Labeo rohita]
MISLNLVGFELAKVDKGKKIKKLQASSVRDLKKVVGKSRLYVVPRAEVGQPINLPLNQPSTGSNSETTEPINLPLSQPFTGPNSETTEEWRAIRRQQDQEYEQSLRADQEKDRLTEEISQYEERRLKIIEERLMRTNEEPADGIPLKFTFPDGTMKIRRFQVFDQIQALFDFVGTHSSATEYFYIREATSAVSISSTVPGTLLDHYLTAPLNIHVRWMDMEDVQAIFHQQNSVLLPSPDEFETTVREDRYYLVGKAIAVSMVHGGPSPGFFSSTLFECISNGQVSPTIEDVNDLDLQAKIKKISHAATMEELCEATECMSEYLANAGCLRAVKCLKDKDLLLQDILLFQVVNRLHGPLERLKEGLGTLGLLEAVVQHKDAFRPLFCSPPQPLTADALDQLFDIRYSTAGSNKRAEENTIVAFWRDYLLDAEAEWKFKNLTKDNVSADN